MLLWKIDPEYSDEARKSKIQGLVVLYIEVDARGQAARVSVRQGLGLGLDERAVEAVRRWKFRPGYRGGRPVTMSALWKSPSASCRMEWAETSPWHVHLHLQPLRRGQSRRATAFRTGKLRLRIEHALARAHPPAFHGAVRTQLLALPEFPRLKSIRGLGISDKDCYARFLADRFNYTNTFYDAFPRFDVTQDHPEARRPVRFRPGGRRSGTHRASA